MKKSLWLVGAAVLLFLNARLASSAADKSEDSEFKNTLSTASGESADSVSEVVPPPSPAPKRMTAPADQSSDQRNLDKEQLVDLNASGANARIVQLERRVSDLEHNYRMLEDKIRSLDRSIVDLDRRVR